MSKIHHIPNLGRIEDEATAWIARLYADDVTDGERARFETWRTAHTVHARVYDELHATWTKLRGAGPLVRAVSFAQAMNVAATPRVVRTIVSMPLRAWSMAATVLIALMLVAFYWTPWRTTHRYTTSLGEQATVALPDGSSLELNSNSAASVDYSKKARMIRLERGEAFFQVVHDTQRPFWVVAGGSWVRAVGTAFNVYLRPTDVRVTVSQGTVKVGTSVALRGGDPSDTAVAVEPMTVLTAGEQAVIHGSATDTRKLTSAELQRSLTWREGTVYFENQPLGEVVAELNRYSTLQLVIDDARLQQLPVGGTFETTPKGVESLLTMLERGFGVTVQRNAERVLIRSSDGHASR